MSVRIEIADADTHASLFAAIVAERDASEHTLFTESAIAVVHEEQAGCRVARDVDVGPAVFVEIGGDDGHPVTLWSGGDSRRVAHVGQRSVSVVAIERVAPLWESARPAQDGDALPVAVSVLAGHRRALEG